jgi:hypothetical protein
MQVSGRFENRRYFVRFDYVFPGYDNVETSCEAELMNAGCLASGLRFLHARPK